MEVISSSSARTTVHIMGMVTRNGSIFLYLKQRAGLRLSGTVTKTMESWQISTVLIFTTTFIVRIFPSGLDSIETVKTQGCSDFYKTNKIGHHNSNNRVANIKTRRFIFLLTASCLNFSRVLQVDPGSGLRALQIIKAGK